MSAPDRFALSSRIIPGCTRCGNLPVEGRTLCVRCDRERSQIEALEAALPLLVRLGDFIANQENRCEVILAVRDALDRAKVGGA